MNKLCIVILLSAIGFIYCSNNCDPQCISGTRCCNSACFDAASQHCCDGTIQNNVGKLPQCCGTQIIDFSTQTCCDKTVHDRINGGITWCCGSDVYSPTSGNECCNGVVVPIGTCASKSKFLVVSNGRCQPDCAEQEKCCDAVCYDRKGQLCCNGTVFDKVGEKSQCCGGQAIDESVQVCCNGVTHDRNGITFCCGFDSYSPLTDQCCDQVVVAKGSCITPQ